MSKAKAKKKKVGGRPTKPTIERAARSVMARLYAEEEAILRALCEQFGATEAEVVRRALRALAKAEGVRKT
jgi:hypothetical protein